MPRKMIRSTRYVKDQILGVGHPHFYSGRSATLQALHRIVRFVLFLRDQKPSKLALQELSKFQFYGKGKSALVLGNGPSLGKLIPDNYSDYFDEIFVVNGFHNLEVSEQIKPTFYCLSDPIHQSELDGEKSQEGVRLYKYLSENPNCIRLLPHSWKSKDLTLPNVTLYFDDREQSLFSKNISPLRPRAFGSVTLYKALAVACFMEFDEIFILGFDNTEFLGYRGNLNNETEFEETVYAPIKRGRTYTGKYVQPFAYGMAGRMQSYAHLFGDLTLFRSCPIKNLDPNSLTDTFRKIPSHPAILQ